MNHSQATEPLAKPGTSSSPLFDAFGRRIPPEGLRSACHGQTRRRFLPVQPATDLPEVYAATTAAFGAKGLPDFATFQARARRAQARILEDGALSGLFQGVAVPFLLPRLEAQDLGTLLEDTLLPAVARSFAGRHPEYRFTRHAPAGLHGSLAATPGSRHERLAEASALGPVVGWYFPCLLEYSLPAALEQMDSLPPGLLLAGAADTCAAFIGSPDLLLRREGYPPLLWLAGIQGREPGIGWHFEAYGYNLTFNQRPHLDQAAEYWGSALVFLDQD